MRARRWSLWSAQMLGLLLALSACEGSVVDSRTGALEVVTPQCSVGGMGTMPSGDGVFGDVRDEGSGPFGAWSHATDAGDALVGEPDWLECRINGSRVGNFSGVGTWNGDPGYTFRVQVQDRGTAPEPMRVPGTAETLTLDGTRYYRPTSWDDGRVEYTDGAAVVIPETMPVVEGNAGNGRTTLTFTLHETGERVRCDYRGGARTAMPRTPRDIAAGLTVHLQRCHVLGPRDDRDDEDDDDHRCGGRRRGHDDDEAMHTSPYGAGSVLDVDAIDLHVQSGAASIHRALCRTTPTTVRFSGEVVPYEVVTTGEHDYYRIFVWGPDGSLVHFDDGDLTAGDLSVSLL